MCYKAPGPRCSAHASKIYSDAREKWIAAVAAGDDNVDKLYSEMQDAEKNYYMTPAGQNALREDIENEGGYDFELSYKLEYGIECRKVALQQAKQADKGDVDEDNGAGSRVPDNADSATLNEEYQRLQAELNDRTQDPRFQMLLEDRDEIRDRRKELEKAKEEQQAYLEKLERMAENPLKRGQSEPDFTEEQQLAAQDAIDDEYEKLRAIVDARLDAAYEYHIANNAVEEWKNETALVVARMNEIAGDPGIPYEYETLGDCVRVAEYDSGTREWLEERQKGIGGSDVGMMLRVDPKYGQENFNEFLKSKTEKYSQEEVDAQAEGHSSFAGPTGRGNAWEPMIVREYAAQNPEATVMFSKASWVHKDDPRYKANVDGLLASDGINPDGILEIKTASDMSKWEEIDEEGNVIEKVPVEYRAQVLWYLKQTGFKYADVAVMVDDKHYRQRRIYAHENIDPTEVENKEGEIVFRVGSINDVMPQINKVWNDQVKPRKDGTYTAPSAKTFMDKSHEKARIDATTNALSAWTDKSHEESRSIITGYAAYKKAEAAAGRIPLNRDGYLVEEFKKGGPKSWTRDRVFVDIETSGMSPDDGEIIEIGITRMNPKGEVTFDYTERYGIRNERALDIVGTGAEHVHKIGVDDIRGKRNFRHPEVQAIMQEHLNDPDAVMVAHNKAFEERWFNQNVPKFWKNHAKHTTRRYHALRQGDTKKAEPQTTMDTMWHARYLVHHTKNNKLETYTTGHGIPYENAHSAYADTKMTQRATYAFAQHLETAPYGERYAPAPDPEEEE